MSKLDEIIEQAVTEAMPPPGVGLYDLRDLSRRAIRRAVHRALGLAAQRARTAILPPTYIWGADAMQQFDFGKERAADAVNDLAAEVEDK